MSEVSPSFPLYEVIIKEHHLDTFGHVNNAVYLELYEEARWEIINKNGYGMNEILAAQKGPVLLEANIKFLKEIKLREKIRISFEVVSYNKKIGVCKQQMLNENGTIMSELLVTIGFFDLKERKLIAPTPEWMRAVGVTHFTS